jgi:iron complex transport system substrate-binding protein
MIKIYLRRDIMNRSWKVVLVFLIALAASSSALCAASGEHTEENFTLEIFGNANMDEDIDEKDVAYVEGVIKGTNAATNFSDANYDGRIDEKDIDQIELIIRGEDKELTIIDSADRIVTVKKPVERIIPMVTRSYEPFYILGMQDKIIGVTTQSQQYYSWLPEVQTKPVIGTYQELDYEKVVELNPQVVFGDPRWADEAEKKLSPIGITLVALNFNRQKEFDPELKILAKILGGDEKAEEFLSWKQSHLDWIKEKTNGLESHVRVYATWTDTEPTWTGTEDSGMNEVISMAGGYNIAGGLPGRYATVDPEWILQENPEVVLILSFPSFANILGYNITSYDEAKRFAENVSQIQYLNETDAVNTGSVYIADSFLGDAGCRGFIGALYYAKWFYPEHFKDLNPDEIHREYFEKWLDIEYRGVCAFPPVD